MHGPALLYSVDGERFQDSVTGKGRRRGKEGAKISSTKRFQNALGRLQNRLMEENTDDVDTAMGKNAGAGSDQAVDPAALQHEMFWKGVLATREMQEAEAKSPAALVYFAWIF